MSDPAAGKFECPGGHLEQGESPRAAAIREWQEETGLPFVDGEWTGTWTSPDGIYQGFVYTIACEADLDIFDRQLGSDPDGDVDGTETIAWWDPADLPGNPAIRAELQADMGIVMDALGCDPAGCSRIGADGQTPSEGDEATCPCGIPVVYDELNGWQHGDGSVSHDDGESVSEKMASVAKAADARPKVRERPGPEPVWGTVEDRRATLTRKHLKAVTAAWNAVAADLDPRVLVRQYRAGAGLVAKYADPDRNTALAATLAWLEALYAEAGWAALVAAISDAIRSGMAEGEADALAVAAARQGVTGFVIGRAFTAAYERLADDGSIPRRAADTAQKMLAGVAAVVSGVLAAGPEGGSDDEAAASVAAAVTGNDVQPASSRLTDAVWAAIGAGALALFLRASQPQPGTAEPGAPAPPPEAPGVVMISWITDGNPCKACMDNEDGNPYAPQDVPSYPQHNHCQCELTTYSDISSSLFAAYLLD